MTVCLGDVAGLDSPFTLDLVVKADFIDVCLDNRRTMIARRTDEPDGDRLCLVCRDFEATFRDVTVRPLLPAN